MRHESGTLAGAVHDEPFAARSPDTALRPERAGRGGSREGWSSAGSDWCATRVVRRGRTEPAGVVIVLHGWMSIGLQLAALRHFMAPLRRAGIETWYPWLPAHGPRTPEGSLSGVECLSSDLPGTARNVELAVHETLELAAWLGARGHRVAIMGFSLGGWIAALAATESADFDRVVLYTPVVDPARAFDESPLVGHIRDDLAAAGVSREDAAALMARVAPSTRPLRTPADRVLIVGADDDNVVAPDSLRDVQESWGCDLTWLRAGHITSQWSPTGRRQARAWLGEVGR